MKKIWLILAGVCGASALFFLLRNDFDKAFVVAAIGAVSWFLNYRVQLKEALEAKDENKQDSDEE